MTWLPLSHLLSQGRPEATPLALRQGRPIPFGQFRSHVAAAARLFRTSKCRRGGLLCEDGYLFMVGLLGLAHAGLKVTLPPGGQPGVLAELAGSWDLLVTDSMLEALDGPGEALSTLDSARVRLDVFTSGSTSAPKRVARRLCELEAELQVLQGLWGDRPLATTLATVSHQHIYGLTFKLLWPLSAGRPFASRSHTIWETLLAELTADAVLVTSPAHLGRLGGLERAPCRPGLVLSAGAPLSAEAAADSAAILGLAPTEIYGSTETGALASRCGSAPWQPLPGAIITARSDGRLSVRAPWVGGGSHDGEDVIALRPDGSFTLSGRADRVVKIEGKRVSLAAVEQELTALPMVEDAAVLALPGERDQLGAALVLSPAGQTDLARLGAFRFGRSLRAALADRLEPMALPRSFRFVPAIPTAGLGKRGMAAIAALFEEDRVAEAPRQADIIAIRPGDNAVEIDMVLPPDLYWFQGHFPDFPILPGVVQLDWALTQARLHLGLELDAAPQFQVKYKSGIFPGDRLTLALTHMPAKRRLSFEYRRDGMVCSSGQVPLP